MVLACYRLQETLKEIAKTLTNDDIQGLEKLLSRRTELVEQVKVEHPLKGEETEVIKALESVVALEQLILGLAKRKKDKVFMELKELRSNKKAHIAYGNQSLKGVRP